MLVDTSFPSLVENAAIEHGAPDLLIGGNFYYEMNVCSSHQLSSGFHVLNSLLGQIVAGAGKVNVPSKNFTNIVLFSKSSSFVSFEKKVSQFFDLDVIGIKEKTTQPLCLNNFQKSSSFNGERYEVSLPWKNFPLALDTNFELSLGCLKSTLKFLSNQPNLLREYNDIIANQLKSKIIKIVYDKKDYSLVHYISHLPVICQKSSKLRIVYDASVKSTKCSNLLNDCLYAGSLLLQNLTGILLRYRLYSIVILADLEKAYFQVSLSKKNRDFIRFLWIRDLTHPEFNLSNLVKYRFCRVSFGINCSPFLLAATLISHFEKFHCDLSSEILFNLYVDYVMVSAFDTESARLKVVKMK